MLQIYYRSPKQDQTTIPKRFQLNSWINVSDPNQTEVKRLSKRYELDLDLLNDALDPFEVPRVESESGVIYVYARIPNEDPHNPTIPLLIVIAKKYILTLSKNKPDFLNYFINDQIKYSTVNKIELFMLIFTQINFVYNRQLNQIRKEIRKIRIRLTKTNPKDVIRFVDFERILNDYLSALVQSNVILSNLMNKKFIKLHQENQELLEDLSQDSRQLIEVCQSTLKNIVNIRSAYSTIIDQNLNQIMKFLTTITIILAIPTLIASLFGMNIPLPFAHSGGAFLYILLFNIIVIIIVLVALIRKNWI
ncbi:MAG: hypothetical protein GF332_00400 [Candidatus Moranbacteria bacterium]|nr:hypothetical protein [Candidatus Moranbacteria bacterium]